MIYLQLKKVDMEYDCNSLVFLVILHRKGKLNIGLRKLL